MWLSLWQREKHLETTDRVMHEMKVLTDAVYWAGVYDQLNIGASVAIDTLVRRIFTIVDAYGNPSKPNWDNAKIFGGQGSPDDCVDPTFKAWAARKAKDEAEIHLARSKV